MDLKQMIVDYIFNDEMKAKIVKELNDNVDVPFLSEKTEAKILDAVYDSVEEVINPYDIVYGGNLFRDSKMPSLVTQTLSEIRINQDAHVDRIKKFNLESGETNFESGAFGAYQLMPVTLDDAIKALNFNPDLVIFNEKTLISSLNSKIFILEISASSIS